MNDEPLQTLAIKITKADRQKLITICQTDRRSQKEEIMWLIERRLAEHAEGKAYDEANPLFVP